MKIPKDKLSKALELLQKVLDIITTDGDEMTDGECIDAIFALKIGEYLKEVEHNN